jgi:hypothetical protein
VCCLPLPGWLAHSSGVLSPSAPPCWWLRSEEHCLLGCRPPLRGPSHIALWCLTAPGGPLLPCRPLPTGAGERGGPPAVAANERLCSRGSDARLPFPAALSASSAPAQRLSACCNPSLFLFHAFRSCATAQA